MARQPRVAHGSEAAVVVRVRGESAGCAGKSSPGDGRASPPISLEEVLDRPASVCGEGGGGGDFDTRCQKMMDD